MGGKTKRKQGAGVERGAMLGYCKRRWVESRQEEGGWAAENNSGVGRGIEGVLVKIQVRPSGQVCIEGRLGKCGVTGV